MIQLSAVIITFNEERNIGRCIDSLQGIADEIVVIDSFSTDKTKEICLSKNVKFIEHQWEGYTNTKNFANQNAKHPYIFSIDADEAPDKTLFNSILQAKKEGFKGVYSMNLLTNYCGTWIKHSGWYPEKKNRIFPKSTLWSGEFVHEKLIFQKGVKNTLLPGLLLHFSYYSVKQHKEKAKNNFRQYFF